VAASTGLPPAAIAGLDHREFVALERAAADRWGWNEELLATLAELLHHLIGVQLARGGVKPGPPLRIPRPGRPVPTAAPAPRRRPEAPRVSIRGLAALTGIAPRGVGRG